MTKGIYSWAGTAGQLYRLTHDMKFHPKEIRSDSLNDIWFAPRYSAADIARIREYENRTIAMVMKSMNIIPDIDGYQEDKAEYDEEFNRDNQ